MVVAGLEYVLTVDSAMGGASAGVYCVRSGDVFARELGVGQGQAEMLVPMVQGALEDAGVVMADLGLVVTNIGPGSFTGLRTGMSCARSLALALEIPLVGVNSFEVLAAAYAQDHDGDSAADALCVLVESRRVEFYAQFFNMDLSIESEPLVIAQDDLNARMAGRSIVVIGDALSRFDAGDGVFLENGYDAPEALTMARMGLKRFMAEGESQVNPLYLRDADVSVSKRPQRVLGT